MKIRPVEGRIVDDPARGDRLPKEGREVPNSSYWLRRLRDGDVENVPEKQDVKPTKKKVG